MGDPEISTEYIPSSDSSEEQHTTDGELSRQFGPHSPEVQHPSPVDTRVPSCTPTSTHESEDDCILIAVNRAADRFDPSDSHLTLAVNASLEDSEIESGDDGDSQEAFAARNPDDVSAVQHSSLNDGPSSNCIAPASSSHSEPQRRRIRLRRINIVQDVIDAFIQPDVMNFELKMELIDERGLDVGVVSRDVYSAFWEQFLERCDGEDVKVPSLGQDLTEKKWQAVGRVWLKGFLDHSIIPIKLSPAFILACCQGIESVDEDLLMKSFIGYISASERVAVEKALQGNWDENVSAELLELFSRMKVRHLPSKDNLQAFLLILAHIVFLQEPWFVIVCFRSVVCNAVQLLHKDRILELYESKRATNAKVVQMIKTSNDETLNPQEQSALNHLRRYVGSTDQRKLETFLRFCTGSTVLCDKIHIIEVMFNELSGFSRRPIAYSCEGVLELPRTYESYEDLRTEMDNIFSSDYFTMDIW